MTLKVGLIGCGGIAGQHIRGYLAIPDGARVTAVADIDGENARKAAEQFDGARVFDDYHALVADGDVDAVDICLPHHLHMDAIVTAARAGKHVLCEKPLCLSLDEADAITSAVRENNVTLMCAHNQLFAGAVQRARELLDEGLLGRIYEVRTVDAFLNRGIAANAGWRSSRALVGGGELIDTGYHPTYTLLYLARSEPSEVTAMVGNYRIHSLDGEDSAQVLVRFTDGSVGNVVTSWAYELPAGAWQFLVIGEYGQMHREGNDLHYTVRGEDAVVETFPAVNGWEAEVKDFAACIREGRRPMQNEEDGIAVLKVILGAYQSEVEKRTVPLGQ